MVQPAQRGRPPADLVVPDTSRGHEGDDQQEDVAADANEAHGHGRNAERHERRLDVHARADTREEREKRPEDTEDPDSTEIVRVHDPSQETGF